MYLLFDIGRTKLRIATSSGNQRLDSSEIIETPQSFEEAMDRFSEITQKLTHGEKIQATAGGAPGPLDQGKTKLTKSHLEDWIDKPLKERLQKITNSPTFLENDASLGGLGEAHFGAGIGSNIVAFLTISSGVGGSRIVKGSIDKNVLGFEPGHQIIDAQNLKELEQLVSGMYLKEYYGKKSEEIDDPNVWEEVARNLAVGIFNLICFWSPNIVVLGGGVMRSIDLEKVRTHISKIPQIFPNLPEVVKAKLGDETGLYGALAFLNEKNS